LSNLATTPQFSFGNRFSAGNEARREMSEKGILKGKLTKYAGPVLAEA